MKWQDAVFNYLRSNISHLDADYLWSFSTDKLPVRYQVQGDSCAEQNLHLRKFLSDQLATAPTSLHFQIINWYVAAWGGVRANKPEKIQGYMDEPPEMLANYPITGVATWSKILSLRNPDVYPIFDARVSSSLNAIQWAARVDDPVYFPDLPSRNSIIISSRPLARALARDVWPRFPPDGAYDLYRKTLSQAVAEIPECGNVQRAEMVLFAGATDLARVWTASSP